ncbi:MAG: rhomboid family intramembrane serine protease [Prolixibacteraceae bacterium]|jgi:membrane associated rhomboid family serine protease|nr:rhomboid family intramembrane serine protease [Prolixibacteraceae bacterium]
MPKLTFRYYPQPISPEQAVLEKRIFKYSLFIPVLLLIVMWLIKLSETILGISFVELGMYPRHIKGLIGILMSPLIHGDWSHLIGNSVSFLVLSTALFFFYRKLAMPIFIINYLLSGILLWLGGRVAWHIGASGVIYGLAAFLMLSGIFRKDVRLLTISLIVIFLYGSFIWGLFPIEEGISWDGHLMGAVSGTILAALFHKHGPPTPHYEWEDEEDEEEDKDQDENMDNEDGNKIIVHYIEKDNNTSSTA